MERGRKNYNELKKILNSSLNLKTKFFHQKIHKKFFSPFPKKFPPKNSQKFFYPFKFFYFYLPISSAFKAKQSKIYVIIFGVFSLNSFSVREKITTNCVKIGD